VGIPKGFPKSVGSRLPGFPCFPYSVISMACFGNVHSKIEVTDNPVFQALRYARNPPIIAIVIPLTGRLCWRNREVK
jgi:hypothetical protein